MEMNEPLDLQYPKSNPTIIKVVGVGGGGGNAVNHMYKMFRLLFAIQTIKRYCVRLSLEKYNWDVP